MIIYAIINRINSKQYVGQTVVKPTDRWQKHRWLLEHNQHPNLHLQASWNKYGSCNFEFNVICTANTLDELNHIEAELILELGDNCYNKRAGGGNNGGNFISEETRTKLSNSVKKLWQTGILTGHPKTLETRKKISNAAKGRTNRVSKFPAFCGPDGTVYEEGINLTKFAKLHGVHVSGLQSVINGTYKQHKGWTLASKTL